MSDETCLKILSRVDYGNECWNWQGYIHTDGYGRFRTGRKNWDEVAHRLVYEVLVGDIPDDMTLDHLCLNKSCVNPQHLEVVTQSVNSQRARCNRQSLDLCVNGHELDEVNWASQKRVCLTCHRIRNRKLAAVEVK